MTRQRVWGAIFHIAHNGVTERGKLHTDLVGPACLGHDLYHTSVASILHNPVKQHTKLTAIRTESLSRLNGITKILFLTVTFGTSGIFTTLT